jgi:hypothetical protein
VRHEVTSEGGRGEEGEGEDGEWIFSVPIFQSERKTPVWIVWRKQEKQTLKEYCSTLNKELMEEVRYRYAGKLGTGTVQVRGETGSFKVE